MLSIDFEKCTGCGACIQRCPKQCISWTIGEFGFSYPEIDKEACVNCGLCEKVCPIDKKVEPPVDQKVFAAVHKDSEVLVQSTSGGAFTAISEAIFAQNGVVYGAAMLEEMKVKHVRVESKNGFGKLRSSKYLQSDTGITYKQAEGDLKDGRVVLYSGTPCQIDGLNKFLGKTYENLYTVDIICHGVGSQAYFDKYMEFAKERYGKIKELKFRSKEFVGWSCGSGIIVCGSDFQNEKIIPYRDFDNYYYSYFLSGDIYRKNCYSCKYANTNRVGDFSLGDYWGIEALKLPLRTENGCSLLLVNSDKAMKLMQSVVNLNKIETTIEQAAHCNKQLKAPSKLPENRQKRIEEFETMTGKQIQKEYLRTHRKVVLKGQIKALIPYKVKLLIRSKRK